MVVIATDGAVAAGTIRELHQHHHEHVAARTPATWPHQVGQIPPQAGSFQDRAEATRLAQALAHGGTAVVRPAGAALAGGVLTGMGGVGKTQLAADYARTAWLGGDVDVLVWITAADTAAVAAAYAQAGAEVLGADPSEAARAFLAWLEPKRQERPCRWLVVLDDVADPDDLRGWWPPASPHGRTLVTTRRKDAALAGDERLLIEVGLFTEAESLAYLTAALAVHGRREDGGQLAALARDLGHLPLALSQAAAYLIDAGTSCAAYRTMLADRTRTLAAASPERLPDGQTHTAAAAWTLSIDRADTLQPAGLAGRMLQLAAFLDPNGIPDTVLTGPSARTHLVGGRLPRPLRWLSRRSANVTAEQAVGALRALHRLSLIAHDPDAPHQAVRVHQLVQRAVRDTLNPRQSYRLARTAGDALLAGWPEVESDTALAQALRANTAALTGHAGAALHRPTTHHVLYRLGRSLGDAGQVAAARDYLDHLTRAIRHHMGRNHSDTLAARYLLAVWTGHAGDAAGAVTGLAAVVPDLVRVRGAANPLTLLARHDLAHFRGAAGDTAGAASAMAEVYRDRLRVFGPDHPDTLTSRHELGHLQSSAGDAAGAAAAMGELLRDRLRVLGPDHPHTLTTRSNLAYLQGKAGDAAGAVAAMGELLRDRLRVLGPDHPDTLISRKNLALSLLETGDVAGATSALTELMPDLVRVLGPDHPYTVSTRHNLAYVQGRAKDVRP
ncbi:tetratricopeptide repeat protein [Streptomyces sp. NRRL S-350]|uniref:tetratricopeptide repeat protein n=1 Tax=Streptomyces sp. NRRL S-350 TaxID=1463902 RepID=UPI00068B8BF2|nr:tetratricopeptide repeat protein [Streptomyces sp. NRRL S-350]